MCQIPKISLRSDGSDQCLLNKDFKVSGTSGDNLRRQSFKRRGKYLGKGQMSGEPVVN